MNETSPVWNEIQARIEAAASREQLDTTVSPPVVFPGKPADIAYDVALYNHLQQAAETIPNFDRDLQMNDTAWSQLPLIGTLVQKVRRGLHSIALFYTNRALQHQQQVNKQLWEAVGRLTAVTQQQQRTIETLQAQHAPDTQADS
ncbi:hypothetical protein [Candidatus Leptofilum sp.]|uniref:hypothetical protein n=1 Tax=Candidatus Leptofilum sp. TaxID=3241576 RepID=UPI003B5BA67F